MAWIDLLLLANHEDNYFTVRGVRVDVKRGQTGLAIVNLAKRWKWSQGKIKRFLNELRVDTKIEYQNTNVTTIISILKYEEYQKTESRRRADSIANGDKQEDKEDKEERERRSPPRSNWKKITEQEFYNAIAEYKLEFTKDMLRKFYDYWREPSATGIMRFQLEKTWDTHRRLKSWQDRDHDFSKNGHSKKQTIPEAAPLKTVIS